MYRVYKYNWAQYINHKLIQIELDENHYWV